MPLGIWVTLTKIYTFIPLFLCKYSHLSANLCKYVNIHLCAPSPIIDFTVTHFSLTIFLIDNDSR